MPCFLWSLTFLLLLACAACMALGPSWRFWALIAPCLLYFSWVSAVCLYFLSLASVCLWEWTERWFMGKINMCWLTESSPCFLRVLGLVNLFAACKPHLVCVSIVSSQHVTRLERLLHRRVPGDRKIRQLSVTMSLLSLKLCIQNLVNLPSLLWSVGLGSGLWASVGSAASLHGLFLEVFRRGRLLLLLRSSRHTVHPSQSAASSLVMPRRTSEE